MSKQPAQLIVFFTQLAPRVGVGGFNWPFLGGSFDRVDVRVNAPNENGPTMFRVKKEGVTVCEVTVDAGETIGSVTGLAAAGLLGEEVTYDLVTVPDGGVAGPIMLQSMLEDGSADGGAGEAADAPLPLADFVAAYYAGILGRPPDETEADDAVTALTAGCIDLDFLATAQGLLADLLAGAEFVALGTTDAEFVSALYWGYFNNAPDPGGLAFHVGQIAATSRAAVQATFATHRAFVNRLALYCRNLLPQADAVLIGGADPDDFVTDIAGPLATGLITAAFAAKGGAGDVDADLNLKAGVVANADLADMAAGTIKGRTTGGGSGVPQDLTTAQTAALLPAVVGDAGAGGTKGLVPAPAAGDAALGKYLNAAGGYSVPPGEAHPADIQVFVADGVWNKPVWATVVHVICIGAGGGGGSGRGTPAGGNRIGGGAGAGGARSEITLRAAALGVAENAVVGQGGAGGAATTNAAANNGGNGGASSFGGTVCFAGGGGGGAQGQTAAVTVPGSGGGGTSSSGNLGNPGGPTPFTANFNLGNSGFNAVGGSGGTGHGLSTNPAATIQGHAEWGGAGGGGCTSAALGVAGASSLHGGGGGGGGGGILSNNAVQAAAAGSTSGPGGALGGGAAAGAVAGGAGGNGAAAATEGVSGAGGGGGGGNAGGNGGAGGAGGIPGGGAGGGGAGTSTGGAGGAGARGVVIVISW